MEAKTESTVIEFGKLAAGETVLIGAASSSVGLAAIQIANMVGATPIALTRGSQKRQALLDAGAAHEIATQEQDLLSEVMAITSGKLQPVINRTFAFEKMAEAHRYMESNAQIGKIVVTL